MYTAQRWTGGIAFVYIVWHTYTMRFTGIDLHDYPMASFGKVQHEVIHTGLFLFYVVGLIAASWHFAYGIWLFCAKWGIVSGDKAQKRLVARLPGVVPGAVRSRASRVYIRFGRVLCSRTRPTVTSRA